MHIKEVGSKKEKKQRRVKEYIDTCEERNVDYLLVGGVIKARLGAAVVTNC